MSIMNATNAGDPNSSPPAPATTAESGREFAVSVARIAADNKTEKVRVLDLRGISSIADFFVLGTGTSGRQMLAVLDFIKQYGLEVGRKPFSISDRSDSHWLLVDYVDVVVHLFDEQRRGFYDLDGLWGDAPQVAWQATTPEANAN